MMAVVRQTAEERRVSVLKAAISEFARSGYAGTSTEAIASRAGISQPYLFRLFGTKKDLFIATFNQVGDRIVRELSEAGRGYVGDEAMHRMGEAYLELMRDPELLQLQLHGFAAASGDRDIAAACRRTFNELWHVTHDEMLFDDSLIQNFFANGMLIAVMSAIDLLSVPEEWAQSLCPGPEKLDAISAVSQALNAYRSSPREEQGGAS